MFHINRIRIFLFTYIFTTRSPNSKEKPFGGLTVVCGGDFRQILPVVSKGTRGDIIDASLNSSYLWPYFKILEFNQNMRLYVREASESKVCKIDSIDKWLLQVGDGFCTMTFNKR